MKISEVNQSGTYIVDYMTSLVGKHIIFVEVENHNNFVVATMDSYTVDPADTDYLDITLTVVESNGVWVEDAFYAIGVYPAEYDTLDSVAERGSVTDVNITTGGLTSDGDLEVTEGNTTTLSDIVEIKDRFPVVNSGHTGAPVDNAGITVNREGQDRWEHQKASGNWVPMGTATYEHDQGLPSAIWTITHNLEKFPSVSVVDTAGTHIMGEVTYISFNQLTINFTSAVSGKAYLN